MKVITTKLKRYKIISLFLNTLMFPVRLPFFILLVSGEFSDKVLDYVNGLEFKFISWIVKIFKFEEIAREQYKINKDKFKIN